MTDVAESHDVIVIGSGMGGLTAASLLSQLAGKRVLLLERHWRAGGFTHSFRRGPFEWDVGLHYLGGLAEGSGNRQLFDLVMDGRVALAALPDQYDHVHIEDEQFAVHGDVEAWQHDLVSRFPHEAAGIRAYFADVALINRWLGLRLHANALPAPIAFLFRLFTGRAGRLAQQTTRDVIHRHVTDPRLRTLLGARWGDYGVAPHSSAFGYHALVLGSYHGGAFYPVGGGSALGAAVTNIVRRQGGDVRVNAQVRAIITEGGRATGVRFADAHGVEHVVHAPIIISDIGVAATDALLPAAVSPSRGRRAGIAPLGPSPSAVCVYMGLSRNPGELGLSGANHWRVRALAPGETGCASLAELMAGTSPMAFLSFGSMNNPAATEHTCQLLMLSDIQSFSAWAGTRWNQRGEDYQRMKAAIAAAAIEVADAMAPGIAGLVSRVEVSTPLTVAHFTGHQAGAIYGLAVTPQRLASRLGATTGVRGLFLAGADICTPGIQGAMMGGIFAAAAAMGPLGFFRIMAAARRGRRAAPAPGAAAFARRTA